MAKAAARVADEATSLQLISQAFTGRVRGDEVHTLLAYLNGLTTHRFTGVYRFEPGWVVSLALFDRLETDTRLGVDVKMKESYCWLTGLGESTYVIEDATIDVRLAGHAAQEAVRSYIAVLLRDSQGNPWGTICHFDFAPRAVVEGALQQLETFRPVIQEFFVQESLSLWNPDAPSLARPRSVPS